VEERAVPNGQMPSWEEWNEQLSEEQRKYSLYMILTAVNARECRRDTVCNQRLIECSEHFEKLDKRKWLDRAVATAVGIGTGIATALGIKIGL
jgi:hypothetical protein